MTAKIDFIEGSTKPCLLAMALPLMAAMFLNMAYNLVDSLWIGNLLGETAYAALTNATPIILILTSIAMGAANGVSILLSQALGAKAAKRAEGVIATALVLAVAFSLGVTALLEGMLPALLAALQTPADVYSLTYGYLSVYLLGYSAVSLYCCFTAVLRSFGNTVFQVAAMLLCTGLNAVLDPFFIHALGFQGAALATLLSQALCLVLMLGYLWRKKLFALHLSAFSVQLIGPFLAKAVPSAFQQSISAISTGFLTALVSGYGVTALAAYGITGKLETILFYPAMALNMVLTTIVGQCAGGCRYDRAKDYLKAALRYGGGLLAVLSVLVVGFARPLAHLFVDSDSAAAIAAVYFQTVGVGYVLNTAANCFLGALNGLGKPVGSMLCMILYYLVVRMPLAWLLSAAGAGLKGIWAAVLVSHAVAAAAALLAADRELRRQGPALFSGSSFQN